MSKHKLYRSRDNSQILQTSMQQKRKNSSTSFSQKSSSPESVSANSLDDGSFFSNKIGLSIKLPYTLKEDELILNYVLKGQNVFRTSSLSLWKTLEAKMDNPKRTYQSLKNRFLRNIKPHLFTTYRYLINDEKIPDVISKFPELKKKFNKKKTFSEIKLKQRNDFSKPAEDEILNESLNEASPKGKKSASKNSVTENDCNGAISPVPKFSENRKLEFIDESTIRVTVNCGKSPRKCESSQTLKINERFKQHQKQHSIAPCSHCGRSGPISNNKEDTDCESDNIIPGSVENAIIVTEQCVNNSVRTSTCQSSPNVSFPVIKLSGRKRSICSSPSLLDISDIERNSHSSPEGREDQSETKKKKKKNVISEDKDKGDTEKEINSDDKKKPYGTKEIQAKRQENNNSNVGKSNKTVKRKLHSPDKTKNHVEELYTIDDIIVESVPAEANKTDREKTSLTEKKGIESPSKRQKAARRESRKNDETLRSSYKTRSKNRGSGKNSSKDRSCKRKGKTREVDIAEMKKFRATSTPLPERSLKKNSRTKNCIKEIFGDSELNAIYSDTLSRCRRIYDREIFNVEDDESLKSVFTLSSCESSTSKKKTGSNKKITKTSENVGKTPQHKNDENDENTMKTIFESPLTMQKQIS